MPKKNNYLLNFCQEHNRKKSLGLIGLILYRSHADFHEDGKFEMQKMVLKRFCLYLFSFSLAAKESLSFFFFLSG